MITIIKQGKTPIYRHTCPICSAIFEFEDDDTTLCWDRINQYSLEIKCPCCKRYSRVNMEDCLVGYTGGDE